MVVGFRCFEPLTYCEFCAKVVKRVILFLETFNPFAQKRLRPILVADIFNPNCFSQNTWGISRKEWGIFTTVTLPARTGLHSGETSA